MGIDSMKDAEDEAFDELAKRQGMWGGGYQAKRAAAADKQEPAQEPVECLDCGSHNVGLPANYDSLVDSVKTQPAQEPAQEPVAWCIKYGGVLLYAECSLSKKEVEGNFARNFNEGLSEIIPLYTAPPQRPWVGLTPEETSGFTQHEMTVVKYVSKVLQEKNT
jgi:hypothetical protein